MKKNKPKTTLVKKRKPRYTDKTYNPKLGRPTKNKYKSPVILKMIMIAGNAVTLAEKLRLTRGSVSNWLKGKSFPSSKNILKMVKLSRGKITFEEFSDGILMND